MISRTRPAAHTASPRGCTNFKLRQITRTVSRRYDAAVAAAGLKTTQYSLLSHIAGLEPVRPSDLAARMNLDVSTLSRNLQPLFAGRAVALCLAPVDADHVLAWAVDDQGRVAVRAELELAEALA